MLDNKTVLLVDDNENLLDMLELLLESTGMNVIAERSALKAALLSRDTKVDLLITDMRMPNLTGEQLATEVRLGRRNALTAIIFISGQSEQEFADLARFPGAVYLRKPFSSKDLLQTAETLLA